MIMKWTVLASIWMACIAAWMHNIAELKRELHGTEVQWLYNAWGGHYLGICLMVASVLFVTSLVHGKYHELDVAEGNAPLAKFAVPGTYTIDEWSEWEE